ncbi:MAG: response regulator transcription factor [Bryobacteraceae bacterium]|nr:response regulator transcription factor [Bryobacteraceae bacterium]
MKTVGVCDTQPIAAEGLRMLVTQSPDLQFRFAVASLAEAATLVRADPPDILVVDKGFGAQAVLSWVTEIHAAAPSVAIIIWANTVSEAEALRMLQSGIRGIIRKSADAASMQTCLQSVSAGTSWMEDSLFREQPRRERYASSDLTPREQQVLKLVEQGMKNREIARELGIRAGTVKIHLKHIFEKTGVRGRYGLAIFGMKDKGLLTLPRA